MIMFSIVRTPLIVVGALVCASYSSHEVIQRYLGMEKPSSRNTAVVVSNDDILNSTSTLSRQQEWLQKEGYRLCGLDPAPQFGHDTINFENDNNPMRFIHNCFNYQCAGAPYDDFMEQHMFPLILQRHDEDPTWGRRTTLLPNEDKSILFIGNSHTRQVVGAMLCHYKDQILSMRHLQPAEGDNVHAVEYTLQGNVTLYLIVNHPAMYSPIWKDNLEHVLLQRPLEELDAIVLGYFNQYTPQYRTTKLWSGVAAYGERYPDQQVNAELYPRGFHVPELASIFSGRIIWMSMFSQHNVDVHRRMEQFIADNSGENNKMRSIDARRHVGAMGGAECSSDDRHKVGTCITDVGDPAYRDGHRCMGNKGGQPDLVAWDLVEALYDVFTIKEDQEEVENEDDDQEVSSSL